jgi:hypothetical protein
MDRIRYEGYVVARNAIAAQPLDEFATWTLCDLAEALLLARDATEAEEAREAVLEGLALLVARHDLTRRAAVRFWVHLKACGPPMYWPPTWEGSPVPSPA